MTCDPGIPVPPKKYGGVERVVDMLCREYTAAGHEVWLIAAPGSKEEHVRKCFFWPCNSSRGFGGILANARFLHQVSRQIRPDVVHSFSRLLYLYPILLTTRIPCLMTYGRRISVKAVRAARLLGGERLHFTCCGAHMMKPLRNQRNWYPVHNPFDPAPLSFDAEAERDALVFLGRIEDIKGTHEAILAAMESGEKLRIAGNIEPEHREYFGIEVEPYLNDRIEYVGPVDDTEKQELFRHAKAFLFPIKWEEPFGIVMAEAMGCGVPVIAFRRGSVPEVVEEGVTGYIVENVHQMAEAVGKAGLLDRKRIQETARRHFLPGVIAGKYLSLLAAMRKKNI